jgi:hypothetical protein
MEIIRLVLKMFLTGVLEFQEKSHAVDGKFSGAKGGASALEIAKKAFPFYGGNIKATFHF